MCTHCLVQAVDLMFLLQTVARWWHISEWWHDRWKEKREAFPLLTRPGYCWVVLWMSTSPEAWCEPGLWHWWRSVQENCMNRGHGCSDAHKTRFCSICSMLTLVYQESADMHSWVERMATASHLHALLFGRHKHCRGRLFGKQQGTCFELDRVREMWIVFNAVRSP